MVGDISAKNNLIVSTVGKPFSTDPYLYDAFVHHIAFRSVYSSLITQYQLGALQGLVAETWQVSSDYKHWTFKIRNSFKFENGDLITPKIVVQSLQRLAYLQKQKKSSSDIFDNLVGIDHLTQITPTIEGMKYTSTEVEFTFKKPIKNLLDLLSFGQYAIVHPNDYDQKTGKWINDHTIISSGAYKITEWNEKAVVLSLRQDVDKSLYHPSAFKTVTISWADSERNTADLIVGHSTDQYAGHDFHGGAISGIGYARCRSWKLKNSPCYEKNNRIALRNSLYSEFTLKGIKVTKSFFPLAMQSITELKNDSADSSPNLKGKAVKYCVSKYPNKIFHDFNNNIESAILKTGAIPKRIEIDNTLFIKEYNQDLQNYSADIYILNTNILIEEPLNDVRFMFFSKEGVRLPDPDLSASAELNKSNPNIQSINEKLYNDAIIWPITHFAFGFWSKGFIDFSKYNSLLPPADFQWIGAK